MSKRIKISERKFWEVWPQVKGGFPAPEEGEEMRDRNGDCPITAVARYLGGPVESPSHVDQVLHVKPGVGYPLWAAQVMDVADGNPESFEDVARKLSD